MRASDFNSWCNDVLSNKILLLLRITGELGLLSYRVFFYLHLLCTPKPLLSMVSNILEKVSCHRISVNDEFFFISFSSWQWPRFSRKRLECFSHALLTSSIFNFWKPFVYFLSPIIVMHFSGSSFEYFHVFINKCELNVSNGLFIKSIY